MAVCVTGDCVIEVSRVGGVVAGRCACVCVVRVCVWRVYVYGKGACVVCTCVNACVCVFIRLCSGVHM